MTTCKLDDLELGLYSICKRSDELKLDQQICRVSYNDDAKKNTISIYSSDSGTFVPLDKVGEDSVLEKIDLSGVS